MGTLSFWFELGSTYSYPAAERIRKVASAGAADIRYEPFLLGPIFANQGWQDSPFNIYPAKGAYMWRDLGRLCEAQGLPLRRPSRFPRNGVLATRVCLLLRDEPRLPDLVCELYRANFARDEELSEPDVVASVLVALGLDAEGLIARAALPETKAALRQQVEHARELQIFGAPSFVAAGELFWGGDRLFEALAHADVPCDVPGIRLRPARRADRSDLLQLWEDCGLSVPESRPERDLVARLQSPLDSFIVAEEGGRLVGSCMGGFEGRRGWLNTLGVHPDSRGRGIARALVRAVEARLTVRDCPKVNLQVRTHHQDAIAFYEHLGYVRQDLQSMGRTL